MGPLGRHPDERRRAREFLIAYPTATNNQVMDAVPCSMRTVSHARAEIRRAAGVVPYGDRRHSPKKIVNATETVTKATEGVFDTQTTSDLNSAVETELVREAAANAAADADLGIDGEIDLGKLKRMLWRVVHRNADDRIVVAAASALARIQQEASARALGPGKPLTKREAKDRLLMLFKAVGIDVVVETINEWTGHRNERNVSTNDGKAPSNPSGATATPGSEVGLPPDVSTTGTL